MPGDTPALLAEEVSQPGQRLTRTTVADLARALLGAPAAGPAALILYGPLAAGAGDG